MAVPNTTTFTLQNVTDEIAGAQDDLVECFAEAKAWGFDPRYMGSKNDLLDFRNYNDSDTITFISLRRSTSSGAAACVAGSVSRWRNGTSFSNATKLWGNSGGTSTASSGYYSDGTSWRFWNGQQFTSSGNCTTI